MSDRNRVARTMTTPSKVRVLCDVDDVVANFLQLFISALNASGVRYVDHSWQRPSWDLAKEFKLTQAEEDKVYDLINLPGIANTAMHPMPGAIEGVKRLAKIADVYFITSNLRSSPTWVYDRDKWLVRHFGEEQGSKVVHIHDKFIIPGDLLVDDKAENCRKWQAAWPAGLALYWQASSMPPESGLLSVNAWSQVERFVEIRQKALA